MERLPYLKLVLASFALGTVISILMMQYDWMGAAASSEAGPIDTLMEVSIILSSFVFAIVCVALGYALVKWRVKPGDESDGDPIHGNTKLEIIWTLIPTVIVLFLAGYSWVVLNDVEQKESDAITVNVYSQQFAWTFGYPEDGNKWSEGVLHVPVNRQIDFRMHAQDVIHSFWVPEWRIKKDNVPGITTNALITPDKVGTYQLICTELCGAGHTTMRAEVVVQTQEEYDEWVAGLESEVPEDLLLTADQALELEQQIQEAAQGVDGSGVDETSADNVDQS
jgi:cytochrome c oxidase subunit II